uniref:tRNA (guanine(9)-N(1))-methyltransferase n=1 Tax=Strigamia maritima TaxID=126957 RepID=T1INU4_STRMM
MAANATDEKSSRKRKRKKRKLLNASLGISRSPSPSRKQLKKVNTMANSRCQISVAVDLSFENLMNDRDIRKTLKQVQNCYATNRRLSAPLQLHLTSFGGKIRSQFESIEGNVKWDVHLNEKHFDQVFDKSRVLYLTSDSPNELEELTEQYVYVIGGLVDHNQHKGLCYKLAKQNGYAHARLPIDKYVNMKTRRILAINHVFQILAKWTESRCWKSVLLQVLPERKNAKPKTEQDQPARA